MTSVGYGELSPVSETGKAITVIAAFMGVFLQALMVVSTLILFEMTDLENINYYLVNLIRVKQKLKTATGHLFLLAYRKNTAKNDKARTYHKFRNK